MDILLDTNVLIDYFAEREPFAAQARQLKAMSFFGDVNLWATANAFTDVFYILDKTHGSKEVQQAFIASQGFLKVCSVTGEDIYAACKQGWADFEDCLVAICAQKIKADYIITRDSEGFTLSEATAISPADFLVLMAETNGINYEEISSQER